MIMETTMVLYISSHAQESLGLSRLNYLLQTELTVLAFPFRLMEAMSS